MTRSGTDGSEWVTSSLSFANGNYAQARFLADGSVHMRNSRDPAQGLLTFTPAEWDAFLGGVRLGEFDRNPQCPG